MSSDSTPRTPMLFCERAFGVWFLLWGLILIVDTATPIARRGLFFGHLETFLPSWTWGIIFIVIALGRWQAYRKRSRCWRVRLSAVTFVLLLVVAAMAATTGLFAATVPLTLFAAYVAWWCHQALLRDTRLGL